MGKVKSDVQGSSVALKRALFPKGFSGEVMEIVHSTWQSFSLQHDVRLEENITALFHRALVDAYVAAGRSWFVTIEDPINDDKYGTELGRNDLRFYPPNHFAQTIYFAIECKRLRVTNPSGFKHLADKYVDEGLQRFVDDEKYCAGLPRGGMVGYVMDDKVSEAFTRVKGEMNKKKTQLKMTKKTAFRTPCSVLPSCVHSADTHHNRGKGDEIIVHHLLVGVSYARHKKPA